jgi:putative ABC transport system ATP-binding protein
MHAVEASSPDRAALSLLARAVLTTIGERIDEDVLARATVDLPPDLSWTEAIELVLGGVGLRVQWTRGRPQDAAAAARPDLPRVAIDDHAGGSWWLLADRRAGRTAVITPAHGRPRWMTDGALTQELGPEPRLWARVAPQLPSSSLSPRSGRRRPVDRLWGLLRVERDDVLAIVAFAVATGVLALATPLAIQVLINWLAFGSLLQPVIALAGALMVCLTLAALLRSAQRHAVEVLQRRLFVRAVTDIVTRLRRVRIDRFDSAYGPELVNRFFDVLTLQKAAKTLLLDGLSAALQAAVGLLILALYHPILLAFDVLVIAAVAAALIPGGRGAQDTAIKESKTKYEVAGWIEELARHPLTFRLGRPTLGEERGEALTRKYLSYRAAHFRVFFRQYLGMQVVQVAIPVALLVTCGWLVLEGQLTLGQLVAAEFIVASALVGISKFTDKLETVYDLLAGVDKLGSLVDLPIESTVGLVRRGTDVPATVTMRGVAYRHDGAANGLRHIDLELEAGGRLAVVGGPGSGKSALADLIVGVRHPTEGAVLRDGVPLTALRPDDAYAEVALVRSGGLVAGTLRDNLTLGRSDVDEAQLWDVLNDLGLADAVRGLSDGLDTPLRPDGSPLSETHARALLVARAVLGAPRLIVVDGLLDRSSAIWRDRMLAALASPSAPWTLLLLTEDPVLAARCPRALWLVDGELHVRARSL